MKIKLVVTSMVVAALAVLAPAAQATPPEHCYPAGDMPDLCPVVYRICTTKPGAYVCND